MTKGDPRDAGAFDPIGIHNDGLNIAAAQTLTIPDGATKIMIQTITQNVRFTLDGTTPETAKGFQLKAGDPPIIIPLGRAATIKIIQEAATADLQYQFGSG